jgi:hypothetical protein
MSAFDYNTAGEQRDFGVIPDGTIAVVQLTIREGGAGEDGLLRRSDKGAEMLDCGFTVVEGIHAKHKFFGNMVLSGPTEGHATAANITRERLRAIIESARGIKPKDVSEAANKARVATNHEFDGIRFMARIGVEPAKGEFRARNILASVVTPDMKEWRPVQQVEQPPADPKAIVKPKWAEDQ